MSAHTKKELFEQLTAATQRNQALSNELARISSSVWLDALRESYARIEWRHSDGDKHGNHHIPDSDLKALQEAIERTLGSASNVVLSDGGQKAKPKE